MRKNQQFVKQSFNIFLATITEQQNCFGNIRSLILVRLLLNHFFPYYQ